MVTGVKLGRLAGGIFGVGSGAILSDRSVSAPFFGAPGFISVSEISLTAKLSLEAGSFAEAGGSTDEAGGKVKIFSPPRAALVPIDELARLRNTRSPTPFFPEK